MCSHASLWYGPFNTVLLRLTDPYDRLGSWRSITEWVETESHTRSDVVGQVWEDGDASVSFTRQRALWFSMNAWYSLHREWIPSLCDHGSHILSADPPVPLTACLLACIQDGNLVIILIAPDCICEFWFSTMVAAAGRETIGAPMSQRWTVTAGQYDPLPPSCQPGC